VARLDRLELMLRIGVEGGDVDEILQPATGGGQHRLEVVEGERDLAFEIGLRRIELRLRAERLRRRRHDLGGLNTPHDSDPAIQRSSDHR
jgi:hypothetical protein